MRMREKRRPQTVRSIEMLRGRINFCSLSRYRMKFLQEYNIFFDFVLLSIGESEIDAVLQDSLERSTRHHGKVFFAVFRRVEL